MHLPNHCPAQSRQSWFRGISSEKQATRAQQRAEPQLELPVVATAEKVQIRAGRDEDGTAQSPGPLGSPSRSRDRSRRAMKRGVRGGWSIGSCPCAPTENRCREK